MSPRSASGSAVARNFCRNFWFAHVIDAYLKAVAEGRDWKEACAAAEHTHGDAPRQALTQKGLKKEKGISFCRQHIATKVANGTFPKPFQLPRA